MLVNLLFRTAMGLNPDKTMAGYKPDKTVTTMIMFHKDVARMKAFTDIADERIQSIKAPTFVVINDLDVVTAAHAAQMMHAIPNARLMILPGHHGSSIGAAESSPDEQTGKEAAFTAALVDDFLADKMVR